MIVQAFVSDWNGELNVSPYPKSVIIEYIESIEEPGREFITIVNTGTVFANPGSEMGKTIHPRLYWEEVFLLKERKTRLQKIIKAHQKGKF